MLPTVSEMLNSSFGLIQKLLISFFMFFYRSLYYKTFYGRNLRIFEVCLCLFLASLSRNKYSGILRKSVSYGRKKFYITGPSFYVFTKTFLPPMFSSFF
jgi:hypothetical protein